MISLCAGASGWRWTKQTYGQNNNTDKHNIYIYTTVPKRELLINTYLFSCDLVLAARVVTVFSRSLSVLELPLAVDTDELYTVKPLIKDTLKEDKPPNKGQVLLYTHSIENHL